MTEETLFDLPTSPDQISVSLQPTKLRNPDFSALDYPTARRAMLEYILNYYPDDFNDFVGANGYMTILEIVAGETEKLSLRSDILHRENFLPSAQTERAVRNHLALINQRILPASPATVDIEVSVSTPLTTALEIDPSLRFSVRGPDNKTVYYELYKTPNDYTSRIVIPAGKRGVIAYGLEGRFANDYVTTSTGDSNQVYTVTSDNILESPIFVTVQSGLVTETWTVTLDPLERFGPDDKVVNVQIFQDHAEFMFGDNINGRQPLAGDTITIRYRVGGGIRGRIQSNAINESRAVPPSPPASAPIPVLFRNLAPSVGGSDRETLERAKKRAPRDFAVRAFASDRPASIVTDDDYVQVATTFSHPVFGTVAKAVATIRTGRNANLIELYILMESSNGLATPNTGLKQALKTYLSEYNVATDQVDVLDGTIKTVDLDITVSVGRAADVTFVKTAVNAALDNFFSIESRELNQPLYISDIYELLVGISGVSYVDIHAPADNILPIEELTTTDPMRVGISEIILEGTRQIRFYYDKIR